MLMYFYILGLVCAVDISVVGCADEPFHACSTFPPCHGPIRVKALISALVSRQQ